jgi:hypothetical protein
VCKGEREKERAREKEVDRENDRERDRPVTSSASFGERLHAAIPCQVSEERKSKRALCREKE